MWITWKLIVRETCFCEKIQADYTLSWVFQKYFNIVPMLESRNVDHMKGNCSNAVKNVLFRSFCTPMYASQLWCNFRKSCMQRLRVAYNLVAELYTTCPGERVLVASKFNVTFLPLRLCYVNTSTCFSKRCRKSNNVCLRALMQSDCLYSSLFFEHYNCILLCDWVIELCSVRLINGVSSHSVFAFYLD